MATQQLEELFAQTLAGDYDDDQPWIAVRELHRIGSRDVFQIAADWCRSADPLMRARGADVIGQLGNTVEHPSNNFPQEAFSVIAELVRMEAQIRPLSSGIFALGHLHDPRAVPLAAEYEAHIDSGVRYAVAFALGCYPNHAESIPSLLKLTADADPDVRDWATFALGVLGDTDTPEIRDALAVRLSDVNQDAREEAVVALAKRQDPRTLPCLLELIRQPAPSNRILEAAAFMLGREQAEPDLAAAQYLRLLQERFL